MEAIKTMSLQQECPPSSNISSSSQAEAEVFFNHQVTHIYQKGTSWEVCRKGTATEQFDAVALTVALPQILQLQGDVGSLLEESQRQQLGAVSYSSRYALGLFYKAQAHIDVPWAAKYVSNNPCIRFIAIDDQKRNLESPEYGPSMVVHTSVPFGVKHLEEAKEQVEPIILVKLNKLLPGLPQPDSIKCQKWRYSQAGLGVRGHRTSVWEATSLGVPEHGPRPTGAGWAMIEHTHTRTHARTHAHFYCNTHTHKHIWIII
ncbi:LOW QUALITY PROTEIN: renalase-like [Salmo trutta]|uniref:LOW QUALITY PROTEIN: renalase-like n=1 Tax=Salmo trutta TaxID=8032 RepID=UPI0011306ED1|nr:LOW QUALITY PROTEIN: renalase-like [Salmo trutta]